MLKTNLFSLFSSMFWLQLLLLLMIHIDQIEEEKHSNSNFSTLKFACVYACKIHVFSVVDVFPYLTLFVLYLLNAGIIWKINKHKFFVVSNILGSFI